MTINVHTLVAVTEGFFISCFTYKNSRKFSHWTTNITVCYMNVEFHSKYSVQMRYEAQYLGLFFEHHSQYVAWLPSLLSFCFPAIYLTLEMCLELFEPNSLLNFLKLLYKHYNIAGNFLESKRH